MAYIAANGQYDTYTFFTESINNFRITRDKLLDTNAKLNGKSYNYLELMGRGHVESSDWVTSNVRTVLLYQEDNQDLISRLEQQSSVLETVNTNINQLTELIIRSNPMVAIPEATRIATTGFAETVIGQLNSSSIHGYIFSGSKTNIVPVQGALESSNIVNGKATGNYYYGDAMIYSASISTTQTLEYGITANDESFTNFFAAVHSVMEASHENLIGEEYKTLMGNALAFLKTASAGVVDLLAANKGRVKTILQMNQVHESFRQTLLVQEQHILTPDFATYSAKFSELQQSLDASYATYSIISKLSLANYLR